MYSGRFNNEEFDNTLTGSNCSIEIFLRLEGCQKNTTSYTTGATNMAEQDDVQREECFCDTRQCCDELMHPDTFQRRLRVHR